MHTREELEHKLKETIKESQEEIKKQQQERDAKTTITEDTKEMQGSRADVDHMPMWINVKITPVTILKYSRT